MLSLLEARMDSRRLSLHGLIENVACSDAHRHDDVAILIIVALGRAQLAC